MKRQLFTQEGKEYVIKTISNNVGATYAGNHQFFKRVYVNYDSITNAESVHINTINRIIPLSYSASAISNTGTVVMDVSNCYNFIRSGASLTLLPSYRLALGKLYPYVQRIYFTSDNFNNFIVRYNQLIFSDIDFISPDDKLLIDFTASLANAYAAYGPDNVILPLGTYFLSISFTYLELQR